MITLFTFFKPTKANEIEFQIFPSIIEIESAPGEEINHQIVIKGSGGGEYILKAYALEITDNHGHFVSSRERVDYLNWISFEPETITFESTEEKRVKLKIDIPATAKLGDYYLTVSLERESGNEQGVTELAGALEIPLLITVTQDGYPPIEGEIKEFKTKYIDFWNPISFEVEVENPGFRKLKSFGKIEIVDLITKKTYSKELIPQNILSESSRVIIDEEGFIEGNDYISWISPDIFGIYSARVDIYDRYHEEDNASILLSSPELTFVYLNFFLLLGIILAILLIIVLTIKSKSDNEDLQL